MTYDRDLIELLIESGALRFGDFVLKSGARSPFFIDLGQVNTGRQLCALGEHLARAIDEQAPDTTVLFGPAYKGIVLAAAAAEALWRTRKREVGVLYDRKEAKTHGEGGRFIGNLPTPRDRVLMVDDVLTSGLTKREAADALRTSHPVASLEVLVVVDRRGKSADTGSLRVFSLLTLEDIAAHLEAAGDSRAHAIRSWKEACA